MMKTLITILLIMAATTNSISTHANEKSENEIEYITETEDLTVIYTENHKIKSKIYTKKMLEKPNGDTIYPEGIYIELYGEDSDLSATIIADKVMLFNEQKLYNLIGNVKFNNAHKKEIIFTDHLYWDYNLHKVYTDKLVTIETEDNCLTGIGLEAEEGFKYYKILKPKGIINDKNKK